MAYLSHEAYYETMYTSNKPLFGAHIDIKSNSCHLETLNYRITLLCLSKETIKLLPCFRIRKFQLIICIFKYTKTAFYKFIWNI
jgi:hypothetical protein